MILGLGGFDKYFKNGRVSLSGEGVSTGGGFCSTFIKHTKKNGWLYALT